MLQKFLASSVNPQEISLTIRGLAMSVLPIVMFLTGMTEADFNIIVDVIVQIVFLSLSLLSAIQVVYGLYRKWDEGRWSAVE